MTNHSRKKKSHLWLIVSALLLVLAAVCFAGVFFVRRAASDYYNARYLNVSFADDNRDYSESTDELENPGGGFYCLHGYMLSEDMTETALDELLARDIHMNESKTLVLLEINLLRYRDTALSAHALTQIERILHAWEEAGFQIILRFLYDWDGKAADADPDKLDQIIKHMTQAAPAVNAHADAIYTMQGIFVGSWGEMHGSKHTQTEPMCALMEHLDEVIDPGIFLAVRTPAHRRTILNSAGIFPEKSALATRLGLYNDGMLGSENDLGTYGDTDKNASLALSDHWLRAQELEYQNKLCRFVPNGGEVVIDNPLNDLDAAVEALGTMHVSYLNCRYHLEVLDKWRKSSVQTDDAWNGMDGFTYIERHLSPRFRCTGTAPGGFDFWEDDTAAFTLSLTNTAFAGSYRPLTFRLRIVSDADDAVVFEQEIHADNESARAAANPGGQPENGADSPSSADSLQRLCNGEQATCTVRLPLRMLADGTYRVYLSCEQTESKKAFALANRLPVSDMGYELSSFTLSRTPTNVPSDKELMERYLSHLAGSMEGQAPSEK